MTSGNYAALFISALALAISVYGVLERRNAARRAERLRLAALIAELDGLHFEQLSPPDGVALRDFVDTINSRRGLLCAQVLNLLPQFRKEIISSELRVLAYALSRAGYPDEANRIWMNAVDMAVKESMPLALFARRGYAYFLFNAGRTTEGRTMMRTAVDALTDTDDGLVMKIETLRFWSIEELDASPGDTTAADDLLDEARELACRVAAPRRRKHAYQLLGASEPESPGEPTGTGPQGPH
ncbi:hypothetical protein OHA21_17850 [Actinoplanes sp. NBC_00393]|uniref:hypothetical protein n=1 Tax=Actinoplanes sp. NBC_00393 TaxID=2975953 RepID=UPI002E21776A